MQRVSICYGHDSARQQCLDFPYSQQNSSSLHMRSPPDNNKHHFQKAWKTYFLTAGTKMQGGFIVPQGEPESGHLQLIILVLLAVALKPITASTLQNTSHTYIHTQCLHTILIFFPLMCGNKLESEILLWRKHVLLSLKG